MCHSGGAGSQDEAGEESPDPGAELRPSHDRAYCCLLHGSHDHFFLYAVVLGQRLRKLCPGSDFVLLCAGRWWRDHATRGVLQRVFSHVQHVPLIHAPEATWALRHEYVFSKIQALRLPYRQLVFLDIDLVLRGDLSPLFEVPAPAGLYHGDYAEGRDPVHGQLIVKDEHRPWCVNAGVLRLDPLPSHEERCEDVNAMLAEIQGITFKTSLPEQYYLVERLKGWRHLCSDWNMEVGTLFADPGFTWPREAARSKARAARGQLWANQSLDEVRVFHFSGTRLQPWWYIDLSPQEAYDDAATQWNHRDPRRLVATALFEWRLALQEVEGCAASWAPEESEAFAAVVDRLRWRAADSRRRAVWPCPNAVKSEAHGRELCEGCKQWHPEDAGRWLLGWEGWWLCSDCIVGYIFSDKEPESPSCVECGRRDGGGAWHWSEGRPHWRCGCRWPRSGWPRSGRRQVTTGWHRRTAWA
mmetsp:Transcript_100640/g.217276  ORF Transcript_100640/g.217276 Transcript_100640/m.217276 type:complete len:470 (+) Transcript_100640:78-1487(+)